MLPDFKSSVRAVEFALYKLDRHVQKCSQQIHPRMEKVSQSVFSTVHHTRHRQEHQNPVSFPRCADRVLLYTIHSRFDGILAYCETHAAPV